MGTEAELEEAICAPDLGAILKLERIDDVRFRASTFQRNTRDAIFGGCFLGQACAAAEAMTPCRPPSAMFARFLGPGDANQPLDYEVELTRDGGSFSERRVLARQGDGPVLFEAMMTFHALEAGYNHAQAWMSDSPGPELLPGILDLPTAFPEIPQDIATSVGALKAVDCRLIDPQDYFTRMAAPAGRLWIKGIGRMQGVSGYSALAFLADYMMPVGALMPHIQSATGSGVHAMSLNQAIWFMAEPDPSDWLLHEFESPWAGAGRGLTHGRVYDRSGRLLASTSQELLIRRQRQPST